MFVGGEKVSGERRGVTYNELAFLPRYLSENENNS